MIIPPKSYHSLYDLELKVLQGTLSNDPSYDQGVVDGAQAVLLMAMEYLEFTGDTDYFLSYFAQQGDIEPDSWIWDLVTHSGTRETLGEHAAEAGIPRTKAEVKAAKERRAKRFAELEALFKDEWEAGAGIEMAEAARDALDEAREVLDELDRLKARAEKKEMG